MTTITIQGQDVELSDNFLKLSPEEQNATVQGIARQMGIKPVAPAAAAAPMTYGDRPDDPRFTQNAMDVKQVMRGVPVLGPLLGERASAGMSALANPVTGAGSQGATLGERYAKNLAQEQKARQTYEAAHPVRSTVLQGAGGAASLALGAGEIPMAAKALGMVGPARTAIPLAAASGGIIGGADAAARGESPVAGAVGGALTGAGGVAAGKAVGRVWDAARGMFVDRPRVPYQLDVAGNRVNVPESVITRNPATAGEEQDMLGASHPTAVQAEAQTQADMRAAHDNVTARLDPTGQSTGSTPLQAGESAAADLVQREQQRAADEVARLAGLRTTGQTLQRDLGGGIAGPADPQDVGSFLSQSARGLFTRLRDATRRAYQYAAGVPGAYNPQYLTGAGRDIADALNTAPGAGRVALSPDVTPRAMAAVDAVDAQIQHFMNQAALGRRQFTPADLEEVRKVLVQHLAAANAEARGSGNWQDAAAVRRVMDEFNNWITRTTNRPGGLLSGNAADILAAQNAARQAHIFERTRFSQQGPGDVVGAFMSKMIGKYPGQEMSPGKIIGTILGPPGGAIPENAVPILNHLRDTVFGPQSQEWAAIKRGVLQHLTEAPAGLDPLSELKQAQRVDKFLSNQRHAGAIFDRPEQARLQQYADDLRAARDEPPQKGTIEARIAALSGRTSGEAAAPETIMRALNGPEGAKMAAGLRKEVSPETWTKIRQAKLQEAIGEPEGGMKWGDQKIVTKLSTLLNSDLARELYSPNELLMMKSVLDAHTQLVPPKRAVNTSNTNNRLQAMGKGALKQLLKVIGLTHGGLPGVAGAEALGRTMDKIGEWQAGTRAKDLFLGPRLPLPRQGGRVPPAVAGMLGQIPSFRNEPGE